MTITLTEPIQAIPAELAGYLLALGEDGRELVYDYELGSEDGEIARLLAAIDAAGLKFGDVSTRQTSLEDIFVSLIGEAA